MNCSLCSAGHLREVQGTLVCESCAVVDAVGCMRSAAPPCASANSARKHVKMPTRLSRLMAWGDEQRACPGITELKRVAKSMHLTQATLELAVEIYNDFKVHNSGSLRGDFRKGVMANAVLMAGRATARDKRHQREVMSVFEVPPQTLGRARKMMKAALAGRSYFKEAFGPMSVEDVVQDFLTCKGVVDRRKRQAVINAVREVEARLREGSKIDGKAPSTVAAGILKHVLQDTVTSAEIARLCCTSIHTTNTSFKMVQTFLAERNCPDVGPSSTACPCRK